MASFGDAPSSCGYLKTQGLGFRAIVVSSVDIPSPPQSGPAVQRAGKSELELDVGGWDIRV